MAVVLTMLVGGLLFTAPDSSAFETIRTIFWDPLFSEFACMCGSHPRVSHFATVGKSKVVGQNCGLVEQRANLEVWGVVARLPSHGVSNEMSDE